MKRSQPSSNGSAAKKSRAGLSTDTRHDEPSVWVEIPQRAKARKAVLQTHYTTSGNEIFEEDLDSDDDDDDADGEADDVPVRFLNHFSIFHQVTKEFVSALRLLTEDICEDWVGAGFVRPFLEDVGITEDEDEEAECQLVQLSSLLECNVHWPSKDGQSWSLDQKIYLLTEHGWYILQNPAPSYAPYYNSLQTHHVLTHALLTHILDSSDMPLDVWLEDVQGHCQSSSHLSLSPTILKDKLKSSAFDIYLHAVLGSWKSCNRLIQQIIKSSAIQGLPLPLTQDLLALNSTSVKSNMEVEGTVVTPRAGAIAQRLFCQPFHVVEMSADGGSIFPQDIPLWPVHEGDPKVIEWGENVGDSGAFQAIVLDGTIYRVGDVVIVNPGEDFHRIRAGHASLTSDWCKNNLASQKWFCKINYFYEEPGSKGQNKFFHAQWLQHGSQTFLQEAAHPRALFWLKECDDLPVECIYSHCNLQPWPLGEAAPPDNATGPENCFFTGLTLDDTAHSFSHLSSQEVQQALSYCDELKPCVPCGLSVLENQSQKCVPLIGGGIAYKGVDYHVNDFVYYHNHSGCAVLHIGQINSFVSDQAGHIYKVEVCQYGRYDDLAKRHLESPAALDNRRLFKTQLYLLVEMADIEGKPFVTCPSSSWDKEQWVGADDHFYCDLVATSASLQVVETLLPSALAQCLQCYGQLLEVQTEEQLLMKTCPRLRGLELFAGAGGLSTGLDLSGFVQTRWAVELSSSAAKTLQANHEDAVVYNQDTSILLKHAIDTAEGHNPEPLVSQLGVTLPPMPQRGEVDFIYGGPPCQSFSGMNHSKKINDPRSTLACNMISYVEFYRPKYFLLENVRGILVAPTVEKLWHQFTKRRIVMGVVKFIISALTTLGYQVHFKVLQAGHYGAPQGRQRVIFLGARCDVPLPQFPSPQHHYPKPVLLHHLPNGEALHPHFRPTTCNHPGYMPCVPFYATTVCEAIGDLPKYDWQNPHGVIPESEEDAQQAVVRLAQGIACMTAVATPGKPFTGFEKPTPYPHPPLSRYQHWIRGDNTLITYHYTKRWSDEVVESVLNVPFHPSANHADLPPDLQKSRWLEDNGKSKGKYRTIYGRLDKDGCFITALTTLAPNQKNGKILHPTQHRIITIREAARAQGFPDSYQFLSIGNTPKKCLQDQIKQIGNAVPVPLAMALGKEVGKSWLHVIKQSIHQDKVARLQSPAIE